MVGEYGHVRWGAEGAAYLLVRGSGGAHGAVALALLYGALHDLVDLLLRECVGEGSVGLGAVFLGELALQVAGDVSVDCLFGVALHARVDGGVDLESVGVQVVGLAVLLEVLVAPAVERVVDPGYGVEHVLALVPRGVVAEVGALGRHVDAEHLAEVGCRAVLVVGAVEVEGEGLCGVALVFGVGEVASLDHLSEHDVAAAAAAVGVAHGVVERGVLAESDEGCGLTDGEVDGFLVEVGVRGGLDAYRVVEEVEVVEVEGDDFLLGVVALELDGDDPLDGLLEQSLGRAACCLGVELLGELLGDGRSAARAFLSEQSALDDGASEGYEVDARVVVEAHVLGGYQCFDEMGRDLGVGHADAVLAVEVPCAYDLAVG